MGNARINDLVRDVVHHGDQAMAMLELARSAQREFERSQLLLGDAMKQLRHGYGDEHGVAYAAEIATAQRDQFAHYWVAGELSLPSRPPPSRNPTQPTRRSWAREPFAYYEELDARNDPAVSESNLPGGDQGQGPSHSGDGHLLSGDGHLLSRSPTPSDESSPAAVEEEEDHVPPSPPAPHEKGF
ncbi:hypothetical protein GGX14DRAFT_577552 [Mycena pura]|uniref:Uncharacterized protein n=1 Tax=Mycena pura TaxID=153505 RepID=A0AAD6Y3T8_9AGAR|nr:hypothetical protein GGX14DRAFT_577552 [Mycena pura]